ncbi:MAG: hypothetical protein QOH48_2179 [Actinomycetota bacterium]|jgi:hypothetical protein|nr:hypothetical protein [Actinomycetota bacterium]
MALRGEGQPLRFSSRLNRAAPRGSSEVARRVALPIDRADPARGQPGFTQIVTVEPTSARLPPVGDCFHTKPLLCFQ